MTIRSSIGALLLATLAACGGKNHAANGAKPPTPCEATAAKISAGLLAGDNLSSKAGPADAATAAKLQVAVAKTCDDQHWSDGVIACVAKGKVGEDDSCLKQLTPEQQAELMSVMLTSADGGQ